MKNIFLAVLAIVFLIIIPSCINKSSDDKIGNFSLNDDFGNTLVFDKLPERIISAAPSITETIYFLGAETNLVGVSNYCNYPPEVISKKKIGDLLNPNFEVIKEINPDLILLSAEGNTKNTYYALVNMGFKVFVSNPKDINGIIKMVEDISILTGKQKLMIDKINNLINLYKTDTIIDAKPCLILISVNPLISVNKNTFIYDVFYRSGFDNVFKNESATYPVVNPENIIMKNFDFIFVMSDTTESVRYEIVNYLKNIFLGGDSYKNAKIEFLDQDIYSRPGPRILLSHKYLTSIK